MIHTNNLEACIYIFCRHPTGEPSSIACDNKQDDLFYSTGQHRKLCKPQLRQLKSRERIMKKTKKKKKKKKRS